MKDLLRFNKISLYAIAFVYLFYSCKQQEELVRNDANGAALGTTYNLIYFSEAPLDLQSQIDSVFAVMNHSLSTYIPESDISKINRGDSTLIVDKMFQEVFQLSKEVHKETKGYFDPTVGTLVNAWGFGPGKQIRLDSAKVDSLLNYVGFNKVQLSNENTILKDDPSIYFDFNAIAKGYAIDRLAKMMDANGITNYLLEVGGELVARGINPIKNKTWVVGIDDPQVVEGRELKLIIKLQNKAMASSGNYRKFRVDEKTGKKYVHTINPITGYTKNGTTLGVTVLANSCAEADAYATSFMAMELKEVKMLLKNNKTLEAYIIYLDKNGETQEFMTKGVKKLVVK
ncbi:FAD:protein FMN transferase [uncultured Maribacter sp.]|uniref:FAD:protein FMN transferase n=1 Tax=uncultured Maribacter sp. TaxID=431308 RepID=UPI002633A7AC|nr:FAD:protein FMN transferase [uncultured Maribacter sp.]